jgi:hypothetical protein
MTLLAVGLLGSHALATSSIGGTKQDLSQFLHHHLGRRWFVYRVHFHREVDWKRNEKPSHSPLDDPAKQLEGDEQAAALLDNLKLSEGKALPETCNTDFNMKTDEFLAESSFTEL